MTTLGQLIDRTLRDWLEPADDQPTRLLLTSTISASAADTGVTFDASIAGPEVLEILGPGSLIQADSEEIILGDFDEDAGAFDIAKRAANGTSAALHASGIFLYPHPVWRRKVIFDALCDAIVGLHPELYRIGQSVSMAIAETTYTEVPQAVVDDGFQTPKHFLGATVSNASRYSRYSVEVIDPAPFVTSGIAMTVDGLGEGATGYLIYKAKFLRPTSEADDITTDFGIDQDWERIAILDAVAYLVAGRELDATTQERLSEQLEQQGYPAGTPSQIRDSILRYREGLMNRAQDALRLRRPVTVSTNSVFG